MTAPEFTLVERRLLANGNVRTVVALAPGKRLSFTTTPRQATDDNLAALVAAAVKTGRFDPLPARSFD